MGRTTDAHIAKLDLLGSNCAKLAIAFSSALCLARRINEDIGEVDDLIASHHKVTCGNGTGETVGEEKAITRDRLLRKANTGLEVLGNEYVDHVLGALDSARATLRQSIIAFDRAIQELETFVAAKERGWFTSKKSVPAARQAIRKSREYLVTLKILLQFSAWGIRMDTRQILTTDT
jgi:hypothetical protein